MTACVTKYKSNNGNPLIKEKATTPYLIQLCRGYFLTALVFETAQCVLGRVYVGSSLGTTSHLALATAVAFVSIALFGAVTYCRAFQAVPKSVMFSLCLIQHAVQTTPDAGEPDKIEICLSSLGLCCT